MAMVAGPAFEIKNFHAVYPNRAVCRHPEFLRTVGSSRIHHDLCAAASLFLRQPADGKGRAAVNFGGFVRWRDMQDLHELNRIEWNLLALRNFTQNFNYLAMIIFPTVLLRNFSG